MAGGDIPGLAWQCVAPITYAILPLGNQAHLLVQNTITHTRGHGTLPRRRLRCCGAANQICEEQSQEGTPCSTVNSVTVHLKSLCVFVHGVSS